MTLVRGADYRRKLSRDNSAHAAPVHTCTIYRAGKRSPDFAVKRIHLLLNSIAIHDCKSVQGESIRLNFFVSVIREGLKRKGAN